MMPATIEQFGSLLDDQRFGALTPLEKARFREKAFVAVIGTSPGKRALYDTLPDERKSRLHGAFMDRFNESYGDRFTVEIEPEKEVEYLAGGNIDASVPTRQTLPTRNRPVFDLQTEQFLQDVQDDKVDPSKLDKTAWLEAAPLVEQFAPANRRLARL